MVSSQQPVALFFKIASGIRMVIDVMYEQRIKFCSVFKHRPN